MILQMKKLLFVLFLLIGNLLSAQNSNYNYTGYIQLADSSKILYQLKFNELEGSVIGYSISDPFGVDETKSTIVGTVSQDTFLIKEVDIMSSKAAVLDTEFCLLQMYLHRIEENNIWYLKGTFKGYYADSVTCVNGEVVLIDSLSFFTVKESFIPVQLSPKKAIRSVKTLDENKGLFFKTTEEVLTLLVWDNGKVDKDRINVTHNGLVVLENFTIKKKRKKITITLNKGMNIVSIKALNVGDFPPNTARIQIQGAVKKYEAVTFLNKNEETQISIKLTLE
jgi:hypothetical protein